MCNVIIRVLECGILHSDFSLDDLEIVLKGLYTFIAGYIQVDVKYLLTFNFSFCENDGFSIWQEIKLKGIDDFNRFITSDYEDILSQINNPGNRVGRLCKDNGCKLISFGVSLERYRFGEYILPI